jgi:hypothetical protein
LWLFSIIYWKNKDKWAFGVMDYGWNERKCVSHVGFNGVWLYFYFYDYYVIILFDKLIKISKL